MKKGIFILGVLMFILSLQAYAIPQQINFQGRLTSSDATPITTLTNVTFMLYVASTGGSPIATDGPRSIQPDISGAFSILLNFDSSYFNGNERYLEVQVESQTLSPRQKITAVPYAYYAITAESLSVGGAGNYVLKTGDTMNGTLTIEGADLLVNGNVGIGTAEPGTYKLKVEGTVKATTFEGDGSQLTNLPAGGITRETDTLDSILARGNITTREVTLGGLATIEANTGNIRTAGKLTVSGAATSEFAGPIILAKTSGSVGIGTAEAGQKLTVAGTIESTLGGIKFPNGSIQTAAAGGVTVHTIGESYGGGIVFYVYDGGKHGLIAATSDQSTGIQWYNGTFRSTGTKSNGGVGAGAMNTAMIVATQMVDNQSGNFAAKVCADYSVTGSDGVIYGDWYLPSIFELDLLYQQRAVVGNFVNLAYWSSTEDNEGIACDLFFGNGVWYYYEKWGTYHVRAVRAF